MDKLGAEEGAQGVFRDEIVMEEVLSEIRDIAARGGISCACGSKNWTFQVLSLIHIFQEPAQIPGHPQLHH